MAKVRKDNKGRNLRPGETQRADGSYMYVYKLGTKKKYLYDSDLASLRVKEKQINKDKDDGIRTQEAMKLKIKIEIDRQIPKDVDCQIAICHVISFSRSIQSPQNYRKKHLKQNRHKEGENYSNAERCDNQTLCFFLVLCANRLGDQN